MQDTGKSEDCGCEAGRLTEGTGAHPCPTEWPLPGDDEMPEGAPAALRVVLTLLGLGQYLSLMPWVVSAFRAEIGAVREWVEREERRTRTCCGDGDGEPEPCGTTVLAYLPFDPQVDPWPLFWVRAFSAGDGLDVEAAPLDGVDLPLSVPAILRGSPWLRFDVRGPQISQGWGSAGGSTPSGSPARQGTPSFAEGSSGGGSGGRVLQGSGGGHPNPPDPPWDAGRPELSCEYFRALVARYVTNAEEFAQGPSGDYVGRGALLQSADAQLHRPVVDLICTYLRDYWRAILALQAESPGLDPATVFGTFPFEGSRPGHRDLVEGWPVGSGREVDRTDICIPCPGGALGPAARQGRWFRIHRNKFVMLDSGYSDFGANRTEADVVGLATRLIELSLPLWRTWEQRWVEDRIFDFKPAQNRSLFPIWRSVFLDEPEAHPLFVWMRATTEGEGEGQQGRAHPANFGVTIATQHSWTAFQDARTDLATLRRHAVRHLLSLPGDSFEATAVALMTNLWRFVNKLIRVAELLLHESGHTVAWTVLCAATGVTGDWYKGPSNRSIALDIREYKYPNAAGGASKHYGLTLAAHWWENVLRINRSPRDRMVKSGCKCGDGANPPGLREKPRKYPRYGGWNEPDTDEPICERSTFHGMSLENQPCRNE